MLQSRRSTFRQRQAARTGFCFENTFAAAGKTAELDSVVAFVAAAAFVAPVDTVEGIAKAAKKNEK